MGQAQEAVELEHQTLEVLREILRPEHPDTLCCQGNLSITLRQLGQPNESDQLRASALSTLEQLLGPDHPMVQAVRERRRVDADIEFQPL